MIKQNYSLIDKKIDQDEKLNERADYDARERINAVGIVAEIVFIVMALILFNAYPERIGFIASADRPAVFLPLLAAEFQAYLPLLNLWWGLALALSFYKLQYRRWSPGMRMADFALTVLGVLVLYRLLMGEPILDFHSSREVLYEISAVNTTNLENVSVFVNGLVKLTLGLALVATAFSAIGKLRHLLSDGDAVIPVENV